MPITTFFRDKQGHYFLGAERVTLETLRKFIKRGRKFRVISKRSGKDMTGKAIAHALAYRYIRGRKRLVGEMKAAQNVLRG